MTDTNTGKDRMTRRRFLGSAALLGGTAAGIMAGSAGSLLAGCGADTAPYSLDEPENMLNTVCLQCNTGCGIRVKLQDDVAVKIEGNPYNPWTLVPPIDYNTPLADSALVEGALCPKGQAGVQTAYDPYRIVKVLKRTGPRGSNEWTAIPFDQAVDEIVEGGVLFGDVEGEEDRQVTGLRELWALRDTGTAAGMSDAVKGILSLKTAEEKQKAVDEFKERFKDQLDLLIDSDHPDLGPRNNQVSFVWGRLKSGRSEFIKRFISESFGSVNAHGHTTVCQGSLYFTSKAMSDQFKEGKLTGGKKFYWQADTANVEFLLAIGSAYIEGGYGPTHHARKLMKNLVEDKVRIVVVDPRFSKIAAKAVGEQSWTNASWLVKEDGSFLHASEAGLGQKEKRVGEDGNEWEFDAFVAMVDGKAVPFDPNDEETAVVAEPLVNGEVGGIRVKSSLQLVYESAASKTIGEWEGICGIESGTIVELAREFTSHGKRAVADLHRGVSQHTNGFYNVLAVYSLNALVGNWDWKGGLIKASTYNILGEKEGQPYDFSKLHPDKFKPFGLSVIRHEAKYEESTLFDGYPARRNWYPFSSDVYQEIMPSMADAYPYDTKALFLYMAAPTYSLPGGQTNIDVLADPADIPLIIASDITVGETSMYADYIFPDYSYLERWEFQGSHPSIAQKVQPVRNPAIAPMPETVTVFGETLPISVESMILGIAEKLGLPGFGPDGMGEGEPLVYPEDYYLKMVANIAAGDKPGDEVPDADGDEMKLFSESRRHLTGTVFDESRWKTAVGDSLWPKVVHVLNRGGRYQEYDKAYDGDKFANKYGQLINIYLEKVARARSSITGERFAGLATYFPIMDIMGREIHDEDEGYDLHLITYREISQTKSRTVVDYWLNAIQDTNRILVNAGDARRLGVRDGDRVRVTSRSNPGGVWDLKNGREKPMVGEVEVIEGLRPGIVAFSLGRGHWANGSSDLVIDGNLVAGDARRATGVHANAAMRLDDYLKNTCLVDPVGGSVSFYDTRVRLVKEA